MPVSGHGVLQLYVYGRVCYPGMGYHHPGVQQELDHEHPVKSALSLSGWGFHNFLSGIHPGGGRLRALVVGVSDV